MSSMNTEHLGERIRRVLLLKSEGAVEASGASAAWEVIGRAAADLSRGASRTCQGRIWSAPLTHVRLCPRTIHRRDYGCTQTRSWVQGRANASLHLVISSKWSNFGATGRCWS